MARRIAQLALAINRAIPVLPCKRCGRALRDKVSIFIGLGPVCAKREGRRGPMKQADFSEVLDA